MSLTDSSCEALLDIAENIHSLLQLDVKELVVARAADCERVTSFADAVFEGRISSGKFDEVSLTVSDMSG